MADRLQWERARRDEHRRRLDLLKRYVGCKDCGRKDGRLEFHHRNPDEKTFDVGRAYCRSWSRVLEEQRKCDILCRDCHVARHVYARRKGNACV